MWKDNKITGIGLNNFKKMCKNEKLYNIQKIKETASGLCRALLTYQYPLIYDPLIHLF